MPLTGTHSESAVSLHRPAILALVGLSLLAASLSAFRAVRTYLDDASVGVVLASVAALLALAAAVIAVRAQRWAAIPLGGALVLELLVLNEYVEVAPPRLINMIPLLFALALALVPGRRATTQRPTVESPVGNVMITVALMLMVPIGLVYLTTGLIAPTPDLFGVYLVFALLLAAAVWLAQRGSRWVVAVPIVSAALWPLVVWAGESYLDWSP